MLGRFCILIVSLPVLSCGDRMSVPPPDDGEPAETVEDVKGQFGNEKNECAIYVKDMLKVICGEYQVRGESILVRGGGGLSVKARGIIDKFVASGNVSGQTEAIYESFEGVLRENLPAHVDQVSQCSQSMYTPVADRFCEAKPIVYRTCARREFGVERWEASQRFEGRSGFRGGGGSQPAWCTEYRNSLIANGTITEPSEIAIATSSEVSRRRPSGNVQYNYSCTLEAKWAPVYVSRQDALCGIE